MVCTHLRRPCCCPLLDLTVSCAATAALAAKGVLFQTPAQLQRGGLLVLNGVAYAGYGGNSGDCQECELSVQHPLSRPMMAPGVCTFRCAWTPVLFVVSRCWSHHLTPQVEYWWQAWSIHPCKQQLVRIPPRGQVCQKSCLHHI